MTDNTTNTGGADAGSGSALIDLGSPDEPADRPDELTGTGHDRPGQAGGGATGGGSGGVGFAGLALAVVSLTTNWTSGVMVSRSQYNAEIHAPSSGLTGQQQLNMYASGWQTQGWWGLGFAAAPGLGQGRRDQRDHRGPGRRGPGGPHPDRGVRRAPDRPRRELSPAHSSPST